MRFRGPGWVGGLLVLAALLGWTFTVYRNPEHVAQWLSLLQLCR